VAAYLSPIERPRGLFLRLVFFFARRQFGTVVTPLRVFSARMPLAFTSFYGKLPRLDKKLQLPSQTTEIIRERVASINTCRFCMDATRWYAMKTNNTARFDALEEYQTSALFTDAEGAALDDATELTRNKEVSPDTFARLTRYYSEREICDIVWLVASEHLYNMTNIGLNIGSDGLCAMRPQRATRRASA
jgi:alkylhydroperoxidase family enzyme